MVSGKYLVIIEEATIEIPTGREKGICKRLFPGRVSHVIIQDFRVLFRCEEAKYQIHFDEPEA